MKFFILVSLALIANIANAVTCETSLEIREHVGKQTQHGYFTSKGNVIESINDRFCVHTVLDGTHGLRDKSPILDPEFYVRVGLKVAFSDINKNDHGLDFLGAQKICPKLTLGGTSENSWRAPRSRFGLPKEFERDIEAQSLQIYFRDRDLYDPKQYGQGVFWTGSRDSGIYMWIMNLGSGYTHFAHMDDSNGVMCIYVE
jgi:hypothetical protein